CLQYSSGPYSF
nr:immunoglobulin light chain junction region [Macaca mulatta]MOW41506.1 immunoglobulin light chain junction region [Macaca mulatta]MOW41539.1 immunoglobulin light chain junction region [Macaca mulatta]MOW42919.1 immunoglobulin light chain junction region [Macaca mulatta]MOW43231.1 immunoglobulin light chain junction region [Macaca mulatta]